MAKTILSCWLLILFALGGVHSLLAQEDEFSSAGGFDTLRIESEDKLTVPRDKAKEVWNYLNASYVLNKEGLRKLDPLFTSSQYDEYFVDTYFDTPTLQLLSAAQAAIRQTGFSGIGMRFENPRSSRTRRAPSSPSRPAGSVLTERFVRPTRTALRPQRAG